MDDLNYGLAASFLAVIAFLMFVPGLIVRLGAIEPSQPAREPMGVRHDRLDAEAKEANR